MCKSCAKADCNGIKLLGCDCSCDKPTEDHAAGMVYYRCKSCDHEICTLVYKNNITEKQ